MSEEREKTIFMAKCAEQAERYKEMKDYMKTISQMNVELTVEERNLLSVAYKNVVGSRRASWRMMTAVEEQQDDPTRLELVRDYKKAIEDELDKICTEIIVLLDDNLIPASGTEESKVFHYKLKADYYRYMAEFSQGEKRADAAVKAHEAYTEATKFAEELNTTHPIRLGLALNFSVFHYEIENDPEKACTLAKDAFENAIDDLDTISEEEYKDATLIMQLLKDNLTLWTNEDDDDDGAEIDDGED